MKKFLFVLALLIQSGLLFAQTHPKIWIRNNTACPVYFKLVLSQPHTGGGNCTPGPATGVLSVAPFTSISTYNYSTTPGIPSVPPGNVRAFLLASIISGPTSCPGITNQVIGQPCLVPLTTWTYNALNATCGSCSTVTATWSVSGGIIFLDFN
ncbi:MAG: hypothetical protein EOP54_12575 [Sphingobacteriales bacterium]|nr:MAG: hypothetical protein EOP54_12575 [Sphingobacteriales bacterium]